MVHIASLEEIIQDMDDACLSANVDDIQQVLRRGDEESIIIGHLLQACYHFKNGNNPKALKTLLDVRTLLPLIPLSIISNIIWLCRRMGEYDRAATECLNFAQDAIKFGYTDLGLEACTAAFILETSGNLSLSNDPSMCIKFSSLYNQVAEKLQKKMNATLPVHVSKYPLKVALIVPNLVDDVVAYCQRVLYFARYLDRDRYDLRVYISENLAGRQTPLFPMGCVHCSSYVRGQDTIHELRKLNVPIWACSTSTHFCDSSIQLAQWLSKDRIDVAIFQSSLSTPIDWLAARIAKVGLKMSLHTGCSLFMPEMDVSVYDNAVNLERENDVWPSDAGARHLVFKGTDIAELLNQGTLDRERFGIPDDVILLGTLSNHLEQRLSKPYMDLIANVMLEFQHVWFIAFGSDLLPHKLDYFNDRGVGQRIRFGGKQIKSGAALTMLDVYVNEFPIGGSQSIIEAMACGVPVVAMKYSDAHAESVSAELVGDEYAIHKKDEKGYLDLLRVWVSNRQERLKAAYKLQQRAYKYFSAEKYVASFMDCADEYYTRKYGVALVHKKPKNAVAMQSLPPIGMPLQSRSPGLSN